jgi:fibronectin-binding autotransporter adhesin
MNRAHLICRTLPVALLLATPAPVHCQTWIGPIAPASGDWNTAANWSPAAVPNSTTAAASFGGAAGLFFVNISGNVSAQSLTFSNPNGVTLSSSPGVTLSGVSAMTVTSGATADIYLPSLIIAGGGLTTSTAYFTDLVFGTSTVIGSAGSGGVTATGSGNTTIYGSFAPGSNAVTGGLTNAGPGFIYFGGDGTNLTGGLVLKGGAIDLVLSPNNAPMLGNGLLTLGGGQLFLIANSIGGAYSQTVLGGTLLSAGHTDITASVVAGANLTLGLGNIFRAAGSTIDVAASSGGVFNVTTNVGTTSGLIGSGAAIITFGGGATWATLFGGTIVGLSIYNTDAYTPGTNVDVTVSRNLSGGFATNSMRFNAGSQTLTLSGTNNVIQSGGILVTPNATGGTITGGTLNAAGNGELLVHQYSSGVFTINSALVSTVGLTKTGPSTLSLGGNNTGLTGPININRGDLVVTNPAAVNSASAINFNDLRTGSFLQEFGIAVGANSTITPLIMVSAFAAPGSGLFSYGTSIQNNDGAGTTATLSGIISSALGQTTPISFFGRFNLTNSNTFTGNIDLTYGATLGIMSDGSLGNPANVLTVEANNPPGALVFLNSGVTVARPVIFSGTTRIASNGTDGNTISGLISGVGSLYKDGTGTLTISGINTFTGGITVAAGTLSLGATGAVPGGTNVTVSAGATFTTGTTPNQNYFGNMTLNGGTFRVSAGAFTPLYVNQIVTGASGGTLDFTGVSQYALGLNGAGAAITLNGNSTWVSPSNFTVIFNSNLSDIPITIPAGVTLNNGIALNGAPGVGFRILGGGTLFQNSDPTNLFGINAPLTVVQSEFRITDASSNGGLGNLGTGAFTLDGGTFSYGGTTATTTKAIVLTANGGTIQIESAATMLTANGAITGPGSLTKIGPGTLLLGNAANTFTTLAIINGVIQAPNDNVLGAGPVTINPLGTLTYTGTTTAARMFTLYSGTLGVAAGQSLTLNGGSVGGGFLHGPGTVAVTGGTVLSGVAISTNAVVNVTGASSFFNVSNSGALNVAAGSATPATFASFINQGSGAITVGAVSAVDAADFQTYGTLALNPAVVGSAQVSLLTNIGATPLYFNGGSRTFIGTAATAINPSTGLPAFVAGIDLHGQNAVVAGGLFVNNGFVGDSSTGGAGTATIIADFGSLVKGAGFFQNPVITQNGGKFQAGNSPGAAAFGKLVLGPGGMNNYIFAIDDATGMAGPMPNAADQVSGWGLLNAIRQVAGSVTTSGDFTWTATPDDKFTVAIDTLVNPTTVGTDVPGPMADFDPTRSYDWVAMKWSGAYSGPADEATLNADTTFDTSGFANPVAGTFGWILDPTNRTLLLAYTATAVPEPGTVSLVGLAAALLTYCRVRRQAA